MLFRKSKGHRPKPAGRGHTKSQDRDTGAQQHRACCRRARVRCVCENLGEIQTNADSLLSRAASLRPSRPAAAFLVAVHIGRSTPGGTASASTPVLLSTTKRRRTRLSSDWPCQSALHEDGHSYFLTRKRGGESRREKKPRRCRTLPSARTTGPRAASRHPSAARRASRRRVHVKAPFCPCAARGCSLWPSPLPESQRVPWSMPATTTAQGAGRSPLPPRRRTTAASAARFGQEARGHGLGHARMVLHRKCRDLATRVARLRSQLPAWIFCWKDVRTPRL